MIVFMLSIVWASSDICSPDADKFDRKETSWSELIAYKVVSCKEEQKPLKLKNYSKQIEISMFTF